MPADPTPPRANDPQEREALAKIIDDNRWAPLEGGVVRRTPPRELADAILAAGFRRVAPEPVREERRWENLRDCDACNGTGYVPLAQPEPVQGGEAVGCGWDSALAVGACFKVFDDGDPHGKAYVVCPDGTMIGLGSCEGDMDLKRAQFIAKACNAALAAPAPAAPAGVTITDAMARAGQAYIAVEHGMRYRPSLKAMHGALAAALAAAGKG